MYGEIRERAKDEYPLRDNSSEQKCLEVLSYLLSLQLLQITVLF